MNDARFWLCAVQEYEHVGPVTGDELYSRARSAALALQIISPSGGMHIFLKFQRTDTGYDNIGAHHQKELCTTLLGKFGSAERLGLETDFPAVYAGVSRAFEDRVVRLQNPIILLEQGMQTGHVSLGTLMFVMGLDMVFMAGGIDNFMKRLGGFLGARSFVFPALTLERQPAAVVGEVLNDLYEFRNIIAHGQEIPKEPYRQPYEFRTTDGERINCDECSRIDLLLECGLFMLTTSLRRIFVEGLFDVVAYQPRWKAKMTRFEHCYTDADGPDAIKRRGR